MIINQNDGDVQGLHIFTIAFQMERERLEKCMAGTAHISCKSIVELLCVYITCL